MWQYKNPIYFSKWICRLTHSPFSHVDLLLDSGYLLGSSDSLHAPVIGPKSNPRGVAIRPQNYQRFAVRRDVVILTSADRKDRFTTFCMDQLGKGFDSGALKPSVFLSPELTKRHWDDNDLWWCAELMTRATEIAPLLDWPIPGIKNRVTCADLLLILAPLYDFSACFQPIPGLKMEPWEQ